MRNSNYDPQVTIEKNHNADIFRETTSIIKAGYYTTPSGKRVDLDMQAMIDGGRCYHKDLGHVESNFAAFEEVLKSCIFAHEK